MNKKILLIFITVGFSLLIIMIMMIIFSRKTSVKEVKTPVNPALEVSPTPKTFQFDSSTDLGKELESVDPKVLDSDFDE